MSGNDEGREPIQCIPLGDSALIVQFGAEIKRDVHERVRLFAERLAAHPTLGRLELTTAFTTACVFYDPTCISFADLCTQLRPIAEEPPVCRTSATRVVEIPVCYGGQYGPDLAFVAQQNHLSEEEVAALHVSGDYFTYMIGFAPGFPYLGGLPAQISAPRREVPRANVPAGSVGIAGNQTGIYPLDTPGGWQLIGRTPLVLFRPFENPPSLLQAGDSVRFRAISPAELQAWRGEQR
jgi:inhibitor of KinA